MSSFLALDQKVVIYSIPFFYFYSFPLSFPFPVLAVFFILTQLPSFDLSPVERCCSEDSSLHEVTPLIPFLIYLLI